MIKKKNIIVISENTVKTNTNTKRHLRGHPLASAATFPQRVDRYPPIAVAFDDGACTV